MKEESVVGDFIDATVEVLSTMASIHATPTAVREINGGAEHGSVTRCLDVTGLLGFSGERRGSMLVTFPKQLALRAVGGMLGTTCDTICHDVRDGVGEIVNMIAGRAKTRLQDKGVNFDLSIPNAVVGPDHRIAAPLETARTRIDFEADRERFFVEVYLKEE